MPGANVAPFRSVAWLVPWMSFALPSPGHQLIMFDGGVTQAAGVIELAEELAMSFGEELKKERRYDLNNSPLPGFSQSLAGELLL